MVASDASNFAPLVEVLKMKSGFLFNRSYRNAAIIPKLNSRIAQAFQNKNATFEWCIDETTDDIFSLTDIISVHRGRSNTLQKITAFCKKVKLNNFTGKIEISFQHFFTAATCFSGSCFFSNRSVESINFIIIS